MGETLAWAGAGGQFRGCRARGRGCWAWMNEERVQPAQHECISEPRLARERHAGEALGQLPEGDLGFRPPERGAETKVRA